MLLSTWLLGVRVDPVGAFLAVMLPSQCFQLSESSALNRRP